MGKPSITTTSAVKIAAKARAKRSLVAKSTTNAPVALVTARSPTPRVKVKPGVPVNVGVFGGRDLAYPPVKLSPKQPKQIAHGTRSGLAAGAKPKTLRLEPAFEVGLSLLKGVLHKPVNKMVNEAVGEYIRKRTAEVEADLTGVLAQIKSYRQADPDFKQAIAAFAKAEARHGAGDPLDGVMVDVEPPAAKGSRSQAGPAETMVRELLQG